MAPADRPWRAAAAAAPGDDDGDETPQLSEVRLRAERRLSGGGTFSVSRPRAGLGAAGARPRLPLRSWVGSVVNAEPETSAAPP